MQLKVIIKRVIHSTKKEIGSWYVLSTDKGSCTGVVGWEVKVGDKLVLDGNHGSYQGRPQFTFTQAYPDVPVDPKHRLFYCCERTIGIGEKMRDQIWEEMGANWPDIKPDSIPKMKQKVYEAFKLSIESLSNDVQKVNLISFLMGKGATMNMANTAWSVWENKAQGIINNDCYMLSELPKYGFGDVDKKIRHEFGIGDTDPRRVKAAIEYAMKKITSNGSTVVGWLELLRTSSDVAGGMPDELIIDCVGEMFGDKKLVAFTDTSMIARKVDHDNETLIWEFLTCG